MRTIIWFLYFWLYLIVVLPEYWRVCRMEKRGETERHDRLVRKHVQNWAGRLLRLAGAEITTTGRENIPEGPVVFVANHQGYFDIPLMLTQLDKPNPIVAKKEIMKLPMIRGWMEQLRCVFLDREDPRKSMESLKSAQELLGKGYSVTIFPEGTRNSGGELGEFKAGAIRGGHPCPCTGGAGVHRRQLQADEKGQPVDPSGKGQDPHPASHLHRGDEPRGDPRPAGAAARADRKRHRAAA